MATSQPLLVINPQRISNCSSWVCIGMSVFFNLLRCRGNLQFSNGETPSVVGKPMNSCTSLLEKLKIGRQYSDNGAYYNSKSPALLLLRRKQRVPISDIEKISTMSRHEKMCPAFPAYETISAFSNGQENAGGNGGQGG